MSKEIWRPPLRVWALRFAQTAYNNRVLRGRGGEEQEKVASNNGVWRPSFSREINPDWWVDVCENLIVTPRYQWQVDALTCFGFDQIHTDDSSEPSVLFAADTIEARRVIEVCTFCTEITDTDPTVLSNKDASLVLSAIAEIQNSLAGDPPKETRRPKTHFYSDSSSSLSPGVPPLPEGLYYNVCRRCGVTSAQTASYRFFWVGQQWTRQRPNCTFA